ncbi:DedA family protein [Brevibacillus sp. SYP-B805]|uniref:DedA family protein n=1 Tax=Brevibacillus sp. SYP-B805 TaxID=1578199 RepID=UPI0013EA23A5|nr:DedA family protein [Brevibacillus sp. SYP-B805]NGQ93607.1 DedA family protein [Brevibacillus sp. SYP-B805]
MLHQLTEFLSSWATALVETFGHYGVFIGMIIESACIPLPSEAILLFGGFLVSKGMLSFWGVVAAGVFGNSIGSVATFWIAANGGRTFLEKNGKYFFVHMDHLVKAERWFTKYGEMAVFFGRNLPVVRTFISFPAGMAKMNVVRFVTFSFIGCIPWNLAFVYLGVKLGDHWQMVEPYLHPISYVILAGFVMSAGWILYRKIRNPK